MVIPIEVVHDVVIIHGVVACNNILDGANKDVAVVGEASGEGNSIFEWRAICKSGTLMAP